MKLLKARRFFLIFLGALTGVLILLFGFLNLPFSQRFATHKVNQILQQADVPVQLDAIRKILPGSVNMEGVLISDKQGDTIIFAGSLKADIRLLALLRSKVVLQDLEMERAEVDIGRKSDKEQLNIAAAFQGGQKKDPDPPDKKTAGWEISIKKGKFSEIIFRMSDTISGIQVTQKLSKLNLKGFSLSLGEGTIFLKSGELGTVVGTLALTPRLSEKKKQTGPSWDLGFQNLTLEDIDHTFMDFSTNMRLETKVGQGSVRVNNLDLLARTADFKKIFFKETQVKLQPGSVPEKSQEHIGDEAKSLDWILGSESIELENTDLWLGPDTLHRYSHIDLDIKDVNLDVNRVGMRLKKLNFEMANGFSLEKMKGELDSENNHTALQMELETEYSHIALEASAEAGPSELIHDPGNIGKGQLELEELRISALDISCFLRELKTFPAYDLLSSDPIQIRGIFRKEQSLLGFSGISLSQENNFKLFLDGSLERPFQFQEATGKLDLELSGLDQDWIEHLAAGFGREDSLPDLRELRLRASISDSLKAPLFDLNLLNQGERVDVRGSVDLQKEQFKLAGDFSNFALGDLFAVPGLGIFAGSAELKGAGLKGDRVHASFYLKVDTLAYRDYSYGQTLLVGSMEPGSHAFNLVAKDSALKGNLNVMIHQADSALKVEVAGILQAQLDNLHLYEDTLGVKTSLEGSLSMSGKAVDAELALNDLTFISPGKLAELRQLSANFKTDSVSTELQAASDFFHVEMQLAKPINELDILGQGYKKYFASYKDPSHMTVADRLSELPEITVFGSISDHEALHILLKDTGLYFNDLDLSLVHRYEDKSLNAFVNGSGIRYKMLQSEALSATISDSAGELRYALMADQTSLFSGSERRMQLSGMFARRSTQSSLSILDSMDQAVYQMEVAGRVDSTLLIFEIPGQQILLNGKRWYMDGPGLFSIDMRSKAVSPSLSMNLDSSSIHVDSWHQEQNYRYKLDLNRVKLGYLISKDLFPGSPEGTLSGSIEFAGKGDLESKLGIGLRVSDIRYTGQDLSDIALDVSLTTDQAKQYSLDLLARMDSSRMELNAESTRSGVRNLQASLSHFPFVSIQPFVTDHLSDLGGYVSGKLGVETRRGNVEEFEGELMFEDARLKVNLLNAPFRIPTQRIRVAEERLVFDNFTILDTLEKELKMDGHIDLGREKAVTADLKITSSNLQLMRRDESSDATFGGNVFVDSEFSVHGPLSRPELEGRILLSEGTEIYYQHREDLRLSESEKIVRFVSGPAHEEPPPLMISQNELINSSVKSIVEIDPSTRINVSLAKRMYNLDLNVQGGGQLQYNMLENNQVSLAGRYEIGEGSALLKLTGWPDKSFDITKGGYIRWDGMVENPELRFEAENSVSTSYVNPVDGKRRDIDFKVILQLAGYLSELDVVFTIRTPDQYVMSIINTMGPEEQMRQAISVLLFEIIDLPGISSSTDYMTQQVNQILASQLNQLTKSTIKGVDLSFGLDSYDNSPQEGGRETSTSLSYELSKSLMNNRAQIEFSGRLHDVNQQPGASDLSLNNVSFEYRLDSAANTYLKVYNEHTYDDVFEGEVIKTGIGLTYRKRYRTFRDIWRRKR